MSANPQKSLTMPMPGNTAQIYNNNQLPRRPLTFSRFPAESSKKELATGRLPAKVAMHAS